MIAVTFYSSGRGKDKGKLLSNAVKESRGCIRFHVCSTVSGEMVESLTQTCTLLELAEDDFSTLADQVIKTNLNTKKEAHLMLRKKCCELESIHTGNGFYAHP